MKIVIFSHKDIWADSSAPYGYVTDGGFPFQMKGLSQLFDQTTLMLPLSPKPKPTGLIPLVGHNLQIRTLTPIRGRGIKRKLGTGLWLIRNFARIWRELRKADAVHAAIPGDVGTVAMILARILRKPLLVRYCGNWLVSKTAMERFWKWFMRGCTRSNQVMLATGGALTPPSQRAPHIHWIFSTSLDQSQMTNLRSSEKHFPQQAPRIIIVGRQEQAKGTAFLIEAIAELRQDYPKIHLDVVGDGGSLNQFKNLARELQLEAHVSFWGKLPHPQVIEKLQQAHVFCFPTYSSEGFPKVVLEALASGLPVATTKVSALPLVIGQGGGVLMDVASTANCVAAIRDILKDEARYHMLSQQAHDVASQYSLEAWRDNIGAHLETAWGLSRS